MPFHFRPNLLSGHRPAAPSCRGGASSLLRLAQPKLHAVSGWLGRAAALGLPVHDAKARVPADFASSIITLLEPSRELARR